MPRKPSTSAANARLLVTRPQPQADAWVNALRAGGADAHALPLLAVEPASEPESRAALAQAWQSLDRLALVFFVSPNAVAHFFAARPPGATWPAPLLAASPGPGSDEALQRAGVALRISPAPDAPLADSEAVWAQLQSRNWQGREVLIVRGDGGRDALANWLRDAGAHVSVVQAYRRAAPAWSAAERALYDAACEAPSRHLWLLSSAQALDHLPARPPADRHGWRAVASHPRIAERAQALGWGHVALVPAGLPALLRWLGHADGASLPAADDLGSQG